MRNYTKLTDMSPILKLPDDSDDGKLKLYAGSMIQGLTALTFVNEAYNLKRGDYILVDAFSGGIGLLLCQLIRARGAHVIAIASSDKKLEIGKEVGAEYLVNSMADNTEEKVVE